MRRPTVSVRPWATIEAMIVIAATSKIRLALADLRLQHEEGEQHRGHALRPEPGHERLLRRAVARSARRRAASPAGRATSSAKTTKTTSGGMLCVEAGGDDQRAEDEEGEHLRGSR